MRVGFAVELYGIDRFTVGQPNPGIGGTHYMTLLLAGHLSKTHHVTLFSSRSIDFPGIDVQPIENVGQLSSKDVLIFPASTPIDRIIQSPARLVPWAHNTLEPKLDTWKARASQIVVLTVQQLDLLRWHDAYSKMRVIPYPFDARIYPYSEHFEDYMVFMGAMVEGKGFHHYAQKMSEVLEGRKTKLYVIGGVQTYGFQPTGPLGVASRDYEASFYDAIKGLVPARRVEFLGNLGPEKVKVMQRAAIGLTNPTGASETFCISNLEFMALGVPVVGGYHKGMTHTLHPDPRFHLNRVGDIPRKLNRLLNAPAELAAMRPKARAFALEHSDVAPVLCEWDRVIADAPIPHYSLSRPYLDGPKIPIYVASKLGVSTTFDRALKLKRFVKRIWGGSKPLA